MTTVIAVLAALVLAGIVYQAIGIALARRRFPPPGELVDVGPHRLHLRCVGEGTPAVVFESGIAASSLSWTLVQPMVAQLTRTCSYDRAGLGWSDRARTPRTAGQIVKELRTLLERAGVPPPYVLVGHSFGGYILRAFAARYPSDTAGLVLVDTIEPDEWLALTRERRRILRGGAALGRIGGLVARLGIVRASLAMLVGGAAGGSRAVARLFGAETLTVLEHLVGEVRKLPPDVWPTIQALWCQPKCFASMGDHIASLPASAAEVAGCQVAKDLPIVAISAGTTPADRRSAHEALAGCTTRGRHIVAESSGHWIHLDEPALVVDAIRDVVELTRDPSKP